MDKLSFCCNVYKKLLSSEIESVRPEEIPDKIAGILSKVLKQDVTVQGDGIREDLVVKIKDKR